MSRAFLLLKFLLVGIPLTGSAQMPRPSQDAATLLDRTIARMGGDSALRGIRSLRLDMMTQWARTTFANRPFADLPSYERNVELRDYTTRGWRNTRQFLGGGPATAVVDVVLYGKRDARPRRKMGHYVTPAKTADEAMAAARSFRDALSCRR